MSMLSWVWVQQVYSQSINECVLNLMALAHGHVKTHTSVTFSPTHHLRVAWHLLRSRPLILLFMLLAQWIGWHTSAPQMRPVSDHEPHSCYCVSNVWGHNAAWNPCCCSNILSLMCFEMMIKKKRKDNSSKWSYDISGCTLSFDVSEWTTEEDLALLLALRVRWGCCSTGTESRQQWKKAMLKRPWAVYKCNEVI